MGEVETVTGTYAGKKMEGKRWVFFFDEGGENERKYSAFEPLLNLENLKEGTEYDYAVEHVPTKDDPNKFHHNLGRVARDGEFKIRPTGAKGIPRGKDATEVPQKKQDNREDYWKNRELAEEKQKPIITRLSAASTAATYLQLGSDQKKPLEGRINDLLTVALAVESYATYGATEEMTKNMLQRMKEAGIIMPQKPEPKKEPVEAMV